MAPGIAVTPHKAVKLMLLDPNNSIQIPTLKLGVKLIVTIPLGHTPPHRDTAHCLDGILENLHIQLVLVPGLPAVVVLLVDLYAVGWASPAVHQPVVAVGADVSQQPVHVQV